MPKVLCTSVLLTAALVAQAAGAAADAALELTAEQRRELRIESAPVLAADTVAIEGLPGELQLPLDRSTALAAPFAGRVLQVLADDGDEVRAGQMLAIVASRDFADARARAAKAAAGLELQRAQTGRDRRLFAQGVIAGARVEASAAALRAAEAEVTAAAANLAGVRDADGAAYAIVAPAAGRVVERAVRPGEPIDATTVAFTLVAADDLRLEVRVPATDAERIAIGDRVEIGSTAGRITGKGVAIDPRSQTVKIRAEIPATGRLMAGQRVTARVLVRSPGDAYLVPRAGLARASGAASLFRIEGTSITTVPVVVLAESGDLATVRGPLRAGEAVVVGGVSALKAMRPE